MKSHGRECDNCGRHLKDEDYLGYGSWSYQCPSCGFKYKHGSGFSLKTQLDDFLNSEDDDPYTEDPYKNKSVTDWLVKND